MLRTFDSLRESLLRAGIAPRRVGRYVTELDEHLADLTEQECASGLDVRQARERAMNRLGGDRELAQAMIGSFPKMSLTARAPWMVFVMWPVLLLVGGILVNALLLMHLLWPVQTLTPAEMPERYQIIIEVANVVVNYLFTAVLCAGCVILALRQRLASGWIWVGLGMLAVFSGFCGFHMNVIEPAGGHRGGVVYSVVNLAYLHGRPNLGATVVSAAAHAAVLFAAAATVYRASWKRLIPTVV